MYTAHIRVVPRDWAPDAASDSAKKNFPSLGVPVLDVKAGKYFMVELEAASLPSARKMIDATCRELLVNPISETYDFDVVRK